MPVRATGRVSRIYATEGITYFRLADIPPELTPQDGYFGLEQTHPNYNALYSLGLVAAVNRYNLSIRTHGEITPTETARVGYMVVDWLA
jgi:hypothetical protein